MTVQVPDPAMFAPRAHVPASPVAKETPSTANLDISAGLPPWLVTVTVNGFVEPTLTEPKSVGVNDKGPAMPMAIAVLAVATVPTNNAPATAYVVYLRANPDAPPTVRITHHQLHSRNRCRGSCWHAPEFLFYANIASTTVGGSCACYLLHPYRFDATTPVIDYRNERINPGSSSARRCRAPCTGWREFAGRPCSRERRTTGELAVQLATSGSELTSCLLRRRVSKDVPCSRTSMSASRQ